MKIFIRNTKSGAFFYIASGWARAFRKAGHQVVMWDGDISEWNRASPDIYIGCSGWPQQLPSNHKAKVAIHVNPWCDEIIKVPNGPLINDNTKAIKWTLDQKPDFVFGYGNDDDMKKYWYKWAKYTNIVGMPNAADVELYKRINADPAHSVDIGWVGGYWGYKAINMDKYILNVANNFNTIWYGHSGPKKPFYRGKIDNEDLVLKLFSSAKVCPTTVEPHTTNYGIDIPERIFKLGACGAMVVSDPVAGIRRYFNEEELIIAKNPSDYLDLCRYWINTTEYERRAKAAKLHKAVISKHTYYHRAQKFLQSFGFVNDAKSFDSILKNIR